MYELNTGYNWEMIRGNGRIDGQGGQVGGQGTEVNDGVSGVPDFSTIINNDHRGCTYKEFLACNLKEYDGKGGAIVYIHWIKKMESVQDMSGCRDNQKVKYTSGLFVGKALTWWNFQIHTRSREAAVSLSWEDFKTLTREKFCLSNEMQKLEIELWNHAMVGAGQAAYTDRFHEFPRLVPHLVTPENKRIKRYVYGLAPQIRGMVATTKSTTIQKVMQIAGTLTDEAIRNRSIKKNPEKRGSGGEPSKDRNGRDDNKRTRTGNAIATTTNHVRRENTGTEPKYTTCNFYHPPEAPCRTCLNCNRPGHLAKDCRVMSRNVNPVNARNPAAAHGACFECGGTDHYKSPCPRLNRAQGPGVSHPNQPLDIVGGQGHGNNNNQACGRAFMLGAEEALQNPNIVTGIEPSDLGFSYKIKIASEQLVEIDKHRWIELFSDYDCKIRYHPSKANVVADALSRKERVKPKRIRSINMTLQSSIKSKIITALKEASDDSAGLQRGLDEMIERRSDGALYYLDRIWVPLKGDVRTMIMDEAHKSKFYVHLGSNKMYYDLRDRIAMDFVTKLLRTSSGHDTIWVIMDRLTKSAYFLPMREDYKMDRFWQIMQEALGTKLDMSTAYHPQTDEVREGQLISPELVQETTEKISQIMDRLKVSPWKGVVHFRKKGTLAPRFVGPFEIIRRIGPVAYRLRLLEELNGVYDTFHVLNLKKCLADPTLQIPLDEIQVDAKLNFMEEPVQILEREFKNLKRSRIAIVKVRWNSKRGPEFTWTKIHVGKANNSVVKISEELVVPTRFFYLINSAR
ncbi:putative reverse transcriptase domain-containing protein [Tanacetum coccineum]